MKKQILKIASLALSMVLVLVGMVTYSLANTVQVSDEATLRAAIENGDSNIVLSNDITISAPIEIKTGSKTISINGGGNTLLSSAGVDNMFVINGGDKNITFDNITLDGKNNGRLFDISASTVSINNSTVKNGTTQNFNPVIEADGFNHQRYQGGAVYADGATLNISNTTFVDNHTKNGTPAQLTVNGAGGDAISPHGGAIYIGSQTKLNILGGSFTNNYSGDGAPHGEGGAIKAEGGSHININVTGTSRTVFDGNHNHHTDSSVGGLQGGAIEVTRSTVDINNTDFIVKGGFDTGGAIKFETAGSDSKHNIVKNSTFKLIGGSLPQTPVASTYFGTSGGAIVSQDSFLTVDNSDFTMENNPNVTFAGGHIDIVGGGEFNLLNSRLKGNAPDWMSWNEVWKYKSAKYGGAIAFENGASAKALIRDTEIKNYMVDHTGGTIAVGHRNGNEYGNTTVDLKIEGTTIHNGQAYTYDNNSAGAGIYISPGSKVVVTKSEKAPSTISQMIANYGAAIYNKGEVTIDGGTKIINNRAEQMAGGLFNDGYANINDANFSGNWKQNKWGPTEIHTIGDDPREKSGENVYAKKDVIVGSAAKFDGKDIRVIDKQSSVVLSGPRESVINVSISEKAKTGDNTIWEKDFFETPHRYVGYLVGRGLVDGDLTAAYKPAGTKAYVPTAEDAKKFHFVSRTTDALEIADVNDHTITAKWDYVFNPENMTVVLGQRAKMVYHTNEPTATIDGGQADTEPNGQKLDQLYTVYGVDGNTLLVSINDVKATDLNMTDKTPSLSDYNFKGWGTSEDKEKPKYDVDKSYHEYDFENNNFAHSWGVNGEVTNILSSNTKNTLHTYAVYDKLMVVKAKKSWNAVNKADVILQLVRTDKNNQVIEEKTVTPNDTDWIAFKGVSKIEDGVDITSKYAVIEKDAVNGKIIINDKKYAVDIVDATLAVKAEGKAEENTRYFTVKNSELFNIPVSKTWDAGDKYVTVPTTPDTVQVALYKGDEQIGDPISLEKAKNYSGSFVDVPLTDVRGNDISTDYTVKEVGEANGKVTIGNNKYSVTVTGNATDGFVVANAYLPPQMPLTPSKTKLTVIKEWSDQAKKAENVTVELFKNGVATGNRAVLNETNKWTHDFTNLPVVDNAKSKEKNIYTVKELDEKNKYFANNENITLGENTYTVMMKETAPAVITITNKFLPPFIPITPAKTSVSVEKKWTDEKNKASSVEVVLVKDGVETDKVATLNEENGWKHTFDNLDVVNNLTDAEGVVYTVKEVGEQNGRIDLEGKNYTVTVTGDAIKGFVIENKYNPPSIPILPAMMNIMVEKKWSDDKHKADSVEVELLKNGVPTGNILMLTSAEGYKGTFKDLPVVENLTDKTAIAYTVREVGEEEGSVTIDGNKFTVSISGNDKDGFVITNTYVEPPSPSEDPQKPQTEKPNNSSKKMKAPKTGDETNVTLILGIAFIALVLVLASVLLGRKKNGKK